MNLSSGLHSGSYDVSPAAGTAASTLCEMFERLFSRGSQRRNSNDQRRVPARRTLSSTSSTTGALDPSSGVTSGVTSGAEAHSDGEVIIGGAQQAEPRTGLCMRYCLFLIPESYGPGKEAFRRGIILLIIAVILFATGAILTGLGQSMLGAGFVQLTGPLFIGIALLLVLVAAGYITIAKRLRQEYANRRNRAQLDLDEFDDADFSDLDSPNRDSSVPPSANILPPTYSDAILIDEYPTVTQEAAMTDNISGGAEQSANSTRTAVPFTDETVIFALESEGSASQDNNSNISSNFGADEADSVSVSVLPDIDEGEEMRTLPPTYTEVLLGTPEGESLSLNQQS